jgi:uridine monophosphate synthetase
MPSTTAALQPAFFARLEARARSIDSLLCVGLDPRADTVDGIRDECLRLIEATADFALAFKPNSAFFEVFGPEGTLALLDVIANIPDDIPVILDAKRGDIPSTAEAYARAAFDTLGAHAITVSPYVGRDALEPFIARPAYGAFILCKTSNPDSDWLQRMTTQSDGANRPLFEIIAEHAQQLNSRGNVGLVLGATDLDAIRRARAIAPDVWFLVPGVGAQGGELSAAVQAGRRADGLGMLVNVSRPLARAPNPNVLAQQLRDDIRLAILAPSIAPEPAAQTALPPGADELASALLSSGCVRFGRFTLKSGVVSPIYLDLRRLVSYPSALRTVARAYAAMLQGMEFDRLAGIPYAALPIATAIGLEMDRPIVYPRREAKDYGTRASVEGEFERGETVVVIDDLTTTGGTKIESIEKLTEVGLIVRDVVVLIDREQGAAELLSDAGYRLHSVVTLRQLLKLWRASSAVTNEQANEVEQFLSSGPS